jgi:hypothetical protein
LRPAGQTSVRLKNGDNMWVTKYLYGESPKTAFIEYPDRIVIRSKYSNNIIPLLMICLLTFPLVLSIPHISETHFMIYLAIVITGDSAVSQAATRLHAELKRNKELGGLLARVRKELNLLNVEL